jgi:hypothetical protein
MRFGALHTKNNTLILHGYIFPRTTEHWCVSLVLYLMFQHKARFSQASILGPSKVIKRYHITKHAVFCSTLLTISPRMTDFASLSYRLFHFLLITSMIVTLFPLFGNIFCAVCPAKTNYNKWGYPPNYLPSIHFC